MEVMIGTAISFAIGVVITLVFIFGNFNVQSAEKWEEFMLGVRAVDKLADKLTAENAKLRVALAAGEMTEERKKVAEMTMAALDVVIGSEEVA